MYGTLFRERCEGSDKLKCNCFGECLYGTLFKEWCECSGIWICK